MSPLDDWVKHPHNVRFADLCREAERLGFELRRTRGSHCTYVHPNLPHILTLTPGKSGKAKPYQIRLLSQLATQCEPASEDRE